MIYTYTQYIYIYLYSIHEHSFLIDTQNIRAQSMDDKLTI